MKTISTMMVLFLTCGAALSAETDETGGSAEESRQARHSLEHLKGSALAWGEPEITDGRIAVDDWTEAPESFHMGALFTWHGPKDPVGTSLIEATGPGVALRVRIAPEGKAAASQGTNGLTVNIDPKRLMPDRTNAVFLTWHCDRFVTLFVNGDLVDFWPVKGPMPQGGKGAVKTSAPERKPVAIRWFCMGPGLPTFAQRYRLHELWQARAEVPLDVYPVHQPYDVVLQDPKATLRDPSEVILVDGRWYVYFTRVEGTHGFQGSVWVSSCAETDDPFNSSSWSKPVEVIPKGKPGRDPDGTGCFTPDCHYDGKRIFLFYTGLDSDLPNGLPSARDPFHPEHILVASSTNPTGPFEKTPKHSPHSATERALGYDEATIPGGHRTLNGQPLFDNSLIDHGQWWIMPDGERRYYYKGGTAGQGGSVCVMRDFDENWLNGRRISADPLLWVGHHMENILVTRVDDTLWLQHMTRRNNPVTGKGNWEWHHSWTSPANDGLNWRYIGGGLPHVGSRYSYSHGVAHTTNPEWGIGQMPARRVPGAPGR